VTDDLGRAIPFYWQSNVFIIIVLKAGRHLENLKGAPPVSPSWSQTEGRTKVEATRPRRGGLSSGSHLFAEMNGSEQKGFDFRIREVKASRRIEVRLPGKEEEKKVLSSISTSFPRPWKERPAQRITGVLSLPRKEVILDLTIDHSFLTEPPLRTNDLCLPFLRTYQPFQSKRPNPSNSLIGPKAVDSTHSPVSRTAQVCDSV
jgi:hypothetical protein